MTDLDKDTLEAVREAVDALPAAGPYGNETALDSARGFGYATALDHVLDVLDELADGAARPRRFLVTVKYPRNPDHAPSNKVTDVCPVSENCSDSTGQHHTLLVVGEANLAETKKLYDHVTRIEEVIDE